MAILLGVVHRPLFILISRQHIRPILDQEPTHIQVALGCSVEQCSLAIRVLMIRVASKINQYLRHLSAPVILGTVKDRGLQHIVDFIGHKILIEQVSHK